MQELRLVLIMVGVLAIAALLIHGLWTSRRDQPAKFGEKPLQKVPERDTEGFDDNGIGAVRVIKEKEERKEPALSFSQPLESDPLLDSVVPTTSDVEVSDELHFSAAADEPASAAVAAKQANGDVMTETIIDEMASVTTSEPSSQPVAAAVADVADVVEEAEPEVIVLSVHANDGEVFKGQRLVNVMEQYGLRFGDMHIFHRHIDDTASSKVIFSVANSVKPGVFHRDSDFDTPGISFFMTLPCYGNPEQNFNIMLQTAQQIADEMSGLVLDEQRNMITPQKLDGIREKIKGYLVAQ
ncbi:cell division protein ZipA [Thaumasiovibrio sp. DFM-14]|uniref:cell division protein ZipA n=1 Tax=Thaumasiovibrio sp. DFM-14 TaxID=3384792 RepID=UPI00399F77AB